jgi:hypothetical protein
MPGSQGHLQGHMRRRSHARKPTYKWPLPKMLPEPLPKMLPVPEPEVWIRARKRGKCVRVCTTCVHDTPGPEPEEQEQERLRCARERATSEARP